MRYVLDVSFLLACGWSTHPRHSRALAWLDRQEAFVTTPLSELGFLRVSMSPGYRAAYQDAQAVLTDITSRKSARWIAADARVHHLPKLEVHADVTDAYFVALAHEHDLKLATLDDELCRKPWALDVAVNPL